MEKVRTESDTAVLMGRARWEQSGQRGGDGPERPQHGVSDRFPSA